jgi:hypothetical protein
MYTYTTLIDVYDRYGKKSISVNFSPTD